MSKNTLSVPRILYLVMALLPLAWGCRAPVESPAVAYEFELRELDTLEIVAAPLESGEAVRAEPDSLPVFRISHPRRYDLLHTRLELQFDWAAEEVNGRATLTLRPYFYPGQELVLDAVEFVFYQVSMVGSEEPLDYQYDGRQIRIQLDETYSRGESFSVYLDYTARPRAAGGSRAISSDRGLFFINPRGEEPGKPQQIWTQGETEHNSRWFPTIDKPNERCTQEMFITVEDRFVTLSNGLLISSTHNDDGTRTDYWKMDQPHAPYLFMLAIGEFAVVRDTWQGVPLAYYVEPAFKPDAEAIFAHTPEMLSFFSSRLGLQYPWPKYSQVVVRDYVSGAMENTTASVFGDFVQRDRRELIQNHNDRIVAHELFHQWFGNYVTCESWANLTLNEGFANYSEYLWFEHRYGRDEADMHLLDEREAHFRMARFRSRPLIDFQYEEKEAMFDSHSYNKGGAILHMLRHMLGDEAFFAGLNEYLVAHAYQAVEVHDLRLAFEKTTGLDLYPFFEQWYFQEGHPELDIRYAYDAAAGEALVHISQMQDYERMPGVFYLPSEVEVLYENRSEDRFSVEVTQREQTFRLPVSGEPSLITFDPDHILLCERRENKSPETYAYQFRYSDRAIGRYTALRALAGTEQEALFREALADPSRHIRMLALSYFELEAPESARIRIRTMAARDPHALVRESAHMVLQGLADAQLEGVCVETLRNDSSFLVLAAALRGLAEVDPDKAYNYARQWANEEKSERLTLALARVFTAAGRPERRTFFERHLQRMATRAPVPFFRDYGLLMCRADAAAFQQCLDQLFRYGTDPAGSIRQRYAAAFALSRMKDELLADAAAEQERVALIGEKLRELRARARDPELQDLLDQL